MSGIGLNRSRFNVNIMLTGSEQFDEQHGGTSDRPTDAL